MKKVKDLKKWIELYNEVKDLEKGSYTDESWKAFEEARDHAKAVLDNEDATQEEVDAAAAELQSAIDGLRVSKTTLEYFLNSAKEHLANGDADDAVESVRKLLEEAIAEGESVMAKEDATKEEVMNATVKLMKAIHWMMSHQQLLNQVQSHTSTTSAVRNWFQTFQKLILKFLRKLKMISPIYLLKVWINKKAQHLYQYLLEMFANIIICNTSFKFLLLLFYLDIYHSF